MNKTFEGFQEPRENWSKLPHSFIAALPHVNSLAELKCILYVLRHTWGYKEYRRGKRITSEEFMHGRKRKDGTRIDGGTGLARSSIVEGLKLAVDHGFLTVKIDDSDKARVEKYYSLNIRGVRNSSPDVRNSDTGRKISGQRTEKETPERKDKKEAASLWEAHMGQMLNPYNAEQLAFLVEAYDNNRVLKAINIAKARGKRTVAYVRGILVNGDKEMAAKPAPQPERKPKRTYR